MSAKDYVHACPKLEASFKIDPATGTLLALAICYEAAEKTASAWAAFADVAARAKHEGRADREKAARERAAALEPRLSKLAVSLSQAAERAPGVSIQRDGVPLDAAILGSAIAVDPGEHVITASAPGKRAWSTTVTVDRGGKSVVIPELEDAPGMERAVRSPDAPSAPSVLPSPFPGLAPAPVAAPRASAAPAEEGAPPHRSSAGRTAGFVVGSVGVAGIATGVVFLVRASILSAHSTDEKNKANQNPADTVNGPAADADHSAAINNQWAGFVTGGAGLVALGLGAALVLTSGSSAHAPSSAKGAWILPDAAPGRAGIRLEAVF